MKFKFKKDAEVVFSSDFWYDMTDGGYIKLDNLLEDSEQIKEVKNAIEIIEKFKRELLAAGLYEEM